MADLLFPVGSSKANIARERRNLQLPGPIVQGQGGVVRKKSVVRWRAVIGRIRKKKKL